MTPRRVIVGHRSLAIVASLGLCGATRIAGAQASRPSTARFQPEVRADFIAARTSAAHLGVGIAVSTGTYLRLGIVGAAGQAWHDGQSTAAGRVDGLIRFVFDPLREFRWAPYAAGGIGGIYNGQDKWRAVLVGVIGVEGPATGHIVPAIELGFGGGARIGVALRRAMPNRR